MNDVRRTVRVSAWIALIASAYASACGTPPTQTDGAVDSHADTTMDAPRDGAVDVPTGPCAVDLDCEDGVFCNGAERCMPGAPTANERGCVAASPATPCLPSQTCSEAMLRCVSSCPHDPDADGDGHRSADCGGDDCDDNDRNRYPGNPEVCDAMNHDEDCDLRTFGFRDIDMDGYIDSQCCNTQGSEMHCGDDCNDSRPNMHPALVETCDGLDNDCNGQVDEGTGHVFHVDADGDGYAASTGATMTGCTAPAGYAETVGDCDDTRSDVHPGLPEVCDSAMVDENCDGVANPSALCSCSGDVSQSCAQPGACSSGRQQCINGSWGACSIQPVAEVCNGVDDDCDGAVDEDLSVTCFADGDNDGYAATGAMAQQSCPVPGRDAFAGCPPNQTNRAPMGSDIDCNDHDSTVSPGQPELCDATMRDENCDGLINPPSLCMCLEGATRPCSASGSCGAGNQTCSGGHWSTCSVNPVAESCNGIDDDCDGMVDEGLTVTCYPDADNDGYARSTAMAIQSCPVAGRDGVGGCPTNQTNRAPTGANVDCNDTNSAISPGATELCDSAMVDENCDGMANPASLCACSGSAMRACPQPGACAAGTQTCINGSWGSCSISAVTESCNGIDDNCNGTTDEGTTIGCYPDADNDTYAAMGATASNVCSVSGRAFVGGCPVGMTNRAPTVGSVDCNDGDAMTNPGAVEQCDAAMRDENCDGVANPSSLCACSGTASRACPAPGACAAGTQSCVNGQWGSCSISPVAESCNNIDDNCNGTTDEGTTVTCYVDADNDTYAANGASPVSLCPVGGRGSVGGCNVGYTNRAPGSTPDCNDSDASRSPGATELCNGIDDDCDGMIDEGVQTTYFRDADADGFGSATVTIAACAAPPGYVGNSMDCDDSSSANRPGGVEVCDNRDNDCDGAVDEAGSEASCYPGVPFTTWRCAAGGVCAVNSCAANHANCDGMAANGCEAALQTDPNNCNTCNNNCGVAGACTAGVCDDPSQISAGAAYTCVLRSSGNVACFGANAQGQLGLGNTTEQPSPVWVTDLHDVQHVETANVGGDNGGGEHTCVATNDGTYCAGRNNTGQIGDGTFIGPRTRFTQAASCGIYPCTTTVMALGGLQTCAAQSMSELYCWGSNSFGQIGDGSTVSRPTPQFISYYTDVAAGGNHTCAVAFTSEVYCWGLQSLGALGNNVTTPNSYATTAQRVCATASACQVGGTALTPVDQVASGYQFNCARKTDGTVWCWGYNAFGQCGDNTNTSPRAFPVRAGSLTNITSVTAALGTACALRSDGTVWCWGSNNAGQIGDGTTTDRWTPTQVRLNASTFLTNVVELDAGGRHVCARTSNNNVYCWGVNANGELGLGDHTNRPYATLLPTL